MEKELSNENRHLLKAKTKAKKLHYLLKKRIPEISLGECYNIYARLENCKDWNTLRIVLMKKSDSEMAEKDGCQRPLPNSPVD